MKQFQNKIHEETNSYHFGLIAKQLIENLQRLEKFISEKSFLTFDGEFSLFQERYAWKWT